MPNTSVSTATHRRSQIGSAFGVPRGGGTLAGACGLTGDGFRGGGGIVCAGERVLAGGSGVLRCGGGLLRGGGGELPRGGGRVLRGGRLWGGRSSMADLLEAHA